MILAPNLHGTPADRSWHISALIENCCPILWHWSSKFSSVAVKGPLNAMESYIREGIFPYTEEVLATAPLPAQCSHRYFDAAALSLSESKELSCQTCKGRALPLSCFMSYLEMFSSCGFWKPSISRIDATWLVLLLDWLTALSPPMLCHRLENSVRL